MNAADKLADLDRRIETLKREISAESEENGAGELPAQLKQLDSELLQLKRSLEASMESLQKRMDLAGP
jgi:peptidoglycan hydrolase CwlO-like protein